MTYYMWFIAFDWKHTSYLGFESQVHLGLEIISSDSETWLNKQWKHSIICREQPSSHMNSKSFGFIESTGAITEAWISWFDL